MAFDMLPIRLGPVASVLWPPVNTIFRRAAPPGWRFGDHSQHAKHRTRQRSRFLRGRGRMRRRHNGRRACCRFAAASSPAKHSTAAAASAHRFLVRFIGFSSCGSVRGRDADHDFRWSRMGAAVCFDSALIFPLGFVDFRLGLVRESPKGLLGREICFIYSRTMRLIPRAVNCGGQRHLVRRASGVRPPGASHPESRTRGEQGGFARGRVGRTYCFESTNGFAHQRGSRGGRRQRRGPASHSDAASQKVSFRRLCNRGAGNPATLVGEPNAVAAIMQPAMVSPDVATGRALNLPARPHVDVVATTGGHQVRSGGAASAYRRRPL
jgi:hypothetical protein